METNLSVLCIGDPHFNHNNITITNNLQTLILAEIDKYRPNAVIIMGDLLHFHNVSKLQAHDRATKFLWVIEDKMNEIGGQCFLIIGNHDRINNKDFMSSLHFFNAVKKWKNMKVIDKAEVHTINGHKCAFVPYVPPGRFYEALETIKLKNVIAIFCHQDFNCKTINSEEWDRKGPYIISGHIHDYYRENNLIYVGAPYQTRAGETIDKSISLFNFNPNTKTMKEKRIYTKLTHKYKEVMNLKEFKKYQGYKEMDEGVDMVIKVEINSKDVETFRSSSKYIKLTELGIKIQEKYIDEPSLIITKNNKKIISFRDSLEAKVNEDEKILMQKYLS